MYKTWNIVFMRKNIKSTHGFLKFLRQVLRRKVVPDSVEPFWTTSLESGCKGRESVRLLYF